MATKKWKFCSNEHQEIAQLWSEYQYRHEHVWKTVIQATVAVVTMSVVPYLEAASDIGAIVLVAPIFAGAFAGFSAHRLYREFRLLDPVKDAYLEKTREADANRRRRTSTFKFEVIGYLCGMMVLAFAHAVWLVGKYTAIHTIVTVRF